MIMITSVQYPIKSSYISILKEFKLCLIEH